MNDIGVAVSTTGLVVAGDLVVEDFVVGIVDGDSADTSRTNEQINSNANRVIHRFISKAYLHPAFVQLPG
jgi:hypothetical protein